MTINRGMSEDIASSDHVIHAHTSRGLGHKFQLMADARENVPKQQLYSWNEQTTLVVIFRTTAPNHASF